MNSSVVDLILTSTESSSILQAEKIQSLWSNYGEISRYYLAGGKYSSVIVKKIDPPVKSNHPRGWNTNASHERKLKSYQIEHNWYTHYGQFSDHHSKYPFLINSVEQAGRRILILEDLNDTGYEIRKTQVTAREIEICLSWLANFHAKYMGNNGHELWPIGSYWHLNTRRDEWEKIEDPHLKTEAHQINSVLQNAKYQTIIHGDAKLANFCFHNNSNQVAAVDFQYVGKGCGMKDVAYFFTSCLNEEQCELMIDGLLDYYFQQLDTALNRIDKNVNSKDVIKEWRELFPFAYADFYRFLAGWNPGHWKMNSYSKKVTEEVLSRLNTNKQ